MRRAPPWAAAVGGLLPAFGVTAAVAQAPAPPSVEQIKACVRQMDIGDHWTFDWKTVEVGPPRHPRNAYESLYARAGQDNANLFGYPVHVVYSLNGRAEIDAVYWLIRDPRGRWQIPAICTLG